MEKTAFILLSIMLLIFSIYKIVEILKAHNQFKGFEYTIGEIGNEEIGSYFKIVYRKNKEEEFEELENHIIMESVFISDKSKNLVAINFKTKKEANKALSEFLIESGIIKHKNKDVIKVN